MKTGFIELFGSFSGGNCELTAPPSQISGTRQQIVVVRGHPKLNTSNMLKNVQIC